MKKYGLLLILVILQFLHSRIFDPENLFMFFVIWIFVSLIILSTVFFSQGSKRPTFSDVTGASKEPFMKEVKNHDSKDSKKYKGIAVYIIYLLFNIVGLIMAWG